MDIFLATRYDSDHYGGIDKGPRSWDHGWPIWKYAISDIDEYAYSASLLVSYIGFNYFLRGDLTEEVEERIVREDAVADQGL